MEQVGLEKDMFEVVGKDLESAEAIIRPSLTYWEIGRAHV